MNNTMIRISDNAQGRSETRTHRHIGAVFPEGHTRIEPDGTLRISSNGAVIHVNPEWLPDLIATLQWIAAEKAKA